MVQPYIICLYSRKHQESSHNFLFLIHIAQLNCREIQTWYRYDTYATLNLESTMTLLTVHSVHCIAFDSLPQYATVRMIHCKVRISGREPCKIRCTFAVQKLQLLCCEWYTYKNFFLWWKLSFTLNIIGSFHSKILLIGWNALIRLRFT